MTDTIQNSALLSVSAAQARSYSEEELIVRVSSESDLDGLQGLDPERIAWVEVPLELAHREELNLFSVDVLLTDRRRIRAMPKAAWAVLVVVLPVLGGILWLIVGKARRGPGRMSRTVAPDDDPAFLGTLGRDEVARRAEQDERLRRLEQELADLDDDNPPPAER